MLVKYFLRFQYQYSKRLVQKNLDIPDRFIGLPFWSSDVAE